MRLFSRTGATVHSDPEFGVFQAEDDGSFEVPEDLGERLRRFHIDKKPMWEDEIERQQRLLAEETERANDPATLLAYVRQIAAAVPEPKDVRPAVSPVVASNPSVAVKQPRKRAASKPAAE